MPSELSKDIVALPENTSAAKTKVLLKTELGRGENYSSQFAAGCFAKLSGPQFFFLVNFSERPQPVGHFSLGELNHAQPMRALRPRWVDVLLQARAFFLIPRATSPARQAAC